MKYLQIVSLIIIIIGIWIGIKTARPYTKQFIFKMGSFEKQFSGKFSSQRICLSHISDALILIGLIGQLICTVLI